MKVGKIGRIVLIVTCVLFILFGLWVFGATGELSGLFLVFFFCLLLAINIYKLVTDKKED